MGREMKIMLIDDCLEIAQLIKNCLSHHQLTYANCISQSKQFLKNSSFDLFLIDIMLEDGSGLELLHELTSHPYHKNTPKIMLTANHEISDKVFSLEHGAADYITKPFHPLELKARVDLQLKESTSTANDAIIRANFKLNLHKQSCFCFTNGLWEQLHFTPIEFKLFLALVKANGEMLSRLDLKNFIWGMEKINIEMKGIDTHISHIRKKLGKSADSIVTVHGKGYFFNSQINTIPSPTPKAS